MSRKEFVGATAAAAATLGLTPENARAGAVEVEPRTETHVAPEEITLDVNGVRRKLAIEPRVTLLDALRDRLGLTGTKKGCDQGTCGACTVHVNGRRIDSCLTLAIMHVGDKITTIEGLAEGGQLHPLQTAFIRHDGFQCGYCTPGQIMSAAALASEGHAFDRETIQRQMSGNICRCGCYPHIVDAIVEAGKPA